MIAFASSQTRRREIKTSSEAQMAKPSATTVDDPLPLQALRLLVPPVRLVCAAMWKVMKERDVMQYGTLEEFVTSSCQTAPGLLSHRHQAKLALGLRARLILELCRGQDSPDPNTVQPHLERICVPVILSGVLKTKRDIKIEAAVTNFHDFIQTILIDPAEREHFYKEEFQTEYGPQFDLQLEKLLWEFLVRLDQLLPVPNLAQTVSSWLNVAPSVMEECVLVASQPQQMKALLQNHSCLGHIEPAASLPPCLGDSILSSLSLPPSGRVRESSPGVAQTEPPATNHKQLRDSLPFIEPVFGLMSTKDLPIMLSSARRAGSVAVSLGDSLDQSDSTDESSEYTAVQQKSTHVGNTGREEVKDMDVQGQSTAQHEPGKKPRDERSENAKKDDERNPKRGIKRGRTTVNEGGGGSSGESDGEADDESVSGREGTTEGAPMNDRAARKLLEDAPNYSSLVTACLSCQPRVLLSRLGEAAATTPLPMTSPAPPGFHGNGKQTGGVIGRLGKRKKDARSVLRNTRGVRHGALLSQVDDKENCIAAPTFSNSPSVQTNSAPIESSDDVIVDSEDEAIKKFKGRLFLRRYYKTKHDTYVPTLREFWRPRLARRDLLSPGNGHR